MENLTADRLRQFLRYHQTTGVFTRLVSSGGVTPGERLGTLDVNGYIIIGVDGQSYKAHRLAWLYVYGDWPFGDLDHKDGYRDHNWIDNLRIATMSQNKANSGLYRNNTSGFKGARYHRPNGKWQARIGAHGKRVNLGYYATAEEAGNAYAKAAEEVYGEFARSR